MANAVENFLQTLKRNLEGDPYPGPASAGCVSGTYRVVKMQDPWQGEVLSCKYRIESRLGKGAMSSVYKAVQEPIGRVVALKIMRREFAQDNLLVKRFNREARIVSSLRHRNIMSIHDVGITETGQPFFVMEFLNGMSLESLISECGAVVIPRALPVMWQISDGMSYAHSKGLIHRDLKPANIMLVREDDGSELVKLIDFGIVKLSRSQSASQCLTRKGEVWGSPIYMSPEQCMGIELDARSDIYSQGLVMYEVLTGTAAFNCDATIGEIVSCQLGQMPAPFSAVAPLLHIPESLEKIVFKAIQKKPDNRYGSMDELKEDLEIFAAQHAIKVPKSTDQYIKPQYQDVGVPAAASFAPASARKPGIAPAATHKSGSAPVVSNRGLSAQQLKIAIAFSLALAVFAIVLSVVTLFFSPAKQKNSRLHTSPNSAGAGAGNGTVLTDKCQAPVRKTDAVPEHQRGKSENNSQTTRKKILAAHKEKNKSQTNRSGDDEALLESIYLKKHAGDSTQKWIEIQQKEQSQ